MTLVRSFIQESEEISERLLVIVDFYRPDMIACIDASLHGVSQLPPKIKSELAGCSTVGTRHLEGTVCKAPQIYGVLYFKPNVPILLEHVVTTLANTRIANIGNKLPLHETLASDATMNPGDPGPPLVAILTLDRRIVPEELDPESEDSLGDMIARYNMLRQKAQASKPTEYRVWQQGECPFIDDSRPDSPSDLPDAFICEVAKFMHAAAGIYKDEAAFSAGLSLRPSWKGHSQDYSLPLMCEKPTPLPPRFFPHVTSYIGKKVQLVDFDWAGKAGEARYPISLSTNVRGVRALG
ncbi:hypothetical protein GGX14DRAFT_562914 [Mycena pura]|uniref:Uncharacterized protein n=1 Tax=Mycena pura TaxID=153505 RepID=A0AAD6VN62_9AGAR|nr:hypothetical protein GGX14DRAFT_562914 [Mycena pura]